jgi:2-polyprenyl-3-methyl-5-hydroxy-6-metoxy-1,4-benzoquinol methylase
MGIVKLRDENMSLKTKRGETAAAAAAQTQAPAWDHSTHESFYEYYARESQSEEARGRFQRVRDAILKVIGNGKPLKRVLQVADIGCGAGTQSVVWAETGHSVHALDINEPLLELGRSRAAKAGHRIDFQVGSATKLPWADESMDVCIALELIEHVADWKSCMKEFVRVLRPGGVLFLTTTNQLCPIQEEFNLPLYSWYPARLKRHYENLAMTTRPELANYAKYPAVNWFTFYGLQAMLARSGFRSLDRFEMMNTEARGIPARFIIGALRSVAILRWVGQVCTPGTRILAQKRPGGKEIS